MICDVLIIGGGPAGLTAGIYATRAGLKTVLVEKTAIGGQASTTPEIENYPGVMKTDGFSLTFTMLKQCEEFGVDFVFDNIVKYDFENKLILTQMNGEIQAKAIILATGASPRKLGLPNEDNLRGAGISYCATCDGAFFKGKKVAVVGGGNTAVEDALYLKNFANEVYLVHRRNELRAAKALQERLFKSDVKIVWDSIPHELVGDNKLTGLTVKNVKTDELTTLSVDGVFVAVGQKPATDDFVDMVACDKGYVITDDTMATSVPGIFAAGDLRVTQLRQVVTAVSDGAVAADSAIKFIQENE